VGQWSRRERDLYVACEGYGPLNFRPASNNQLDKDSIDTDGKKQFLFDAAKETDLYVGSKMNRETTSSVGLHGLVVLTV
jgi:hypothetical protein